MTAYCQPINGRIRVWRWGSGRLSSKRRQGWLEDTVSPIPQGNRESSLTFSPSFVSGIDPTFMAACPNEFFSLLQGDLPWAGVPGCPLWVGETLRWLSPAHCSLAITHWQINNTTTHMYPWDILAPQAINYYMRTFTTVWYSQLLPAFAVWPGAVWNLLTSIFHCARRVNNTLADSSGKHLSRRLWT